MLVVCVSLSDQPFCTSRPPLTPRGALRTVKWIKTRGKTERTRRGSSRWEAMASNRGATEAGREAGDGPVGADKFLETVLGVGSLKCFRHMLQPSDLGARAPPRAPRRPPL